MVQHLSDSLYMLFTLILGVDEDVIKVHYHEDVELLCQDLVDIALEYGRYAGQSKRHYLVLEMAIAGLESRLPFVSFPNPDLMVGIGQIKLGETSNPT